MYTHIYTQVNNRVKSLRTSADYIWTDVFNKDRKLLLYILLIYTNYI